MMTTTALSLLGLIVEDDKTQMGWKYIDNKGRTKLKENRDNKIRKTKKDVEEIDYLKRAKKKYDSKKSIKALSKLM